MPESGSRLRNIVTLNGIWIFLITAATGVLIWLVRNRRHSDAKIREDSPEIKRAPARADSAVIQTSSSTIAVKDVSGDHEAEYAEPAEPASERWTNDIGKSGSQPLSSEALPLTEIEKDQSVKHTTTQPFDVPGAEFPVELSEESPPSEASGGAATGEREVEEMLPPVVPATEKVSQLISMPQPTDDNVQLGTNGRDEDSEYLSQPQRVADSLDDSYEPKRPQQYRPPTQKLPRPIDKQNGRPRSPRSAASEMISSIRVHLSFDRYDFCTFSLLPERTSGLDEEITVKFGDQLLRLLAQEIWYQDLELVDARVQLQQGIELSGRLGDGRVARWLLTGRPLYVLASHPGATGFVSTNRLALGRSHVVLCTTEELDSVETILLQAGCTGYMKLAQAQGVPEAWVALRGVSPMKAIPLDSGIDPYYAIKPAPDVEIDFEGGLWLRNSVWIAGYPPVIKLLGDASLAGRVLIDGIEAAKVDGYFRTDGYDRPGQHTVYVEGLFCSASYTIEEPPSSWDAWPAHQYGHAEMCGPLVRLANEHNPSHIVTVPMSNPLLLGSQAGEIFLCSRRGVALWKGYVPFEPVWALPAYPLISDKRTARIIQLSLSHVTAPGPPYSKAMFNWSNAILDAGRKGLAIAHESPQSRACWTDYKKVARKIWRTAR